MFGANTTGMWRAISAIAALPAASKPVVPMTAALPSSRASARCASVPSGRVKSITQSAAAMAAAASSMIATPVCVPASSPASRPMKGVPGRSKADAEHDPVFLQRGLDQHPAHAAGCAGDCDSNFGHRVPVHARSGTVPDRGWECGWDGNGDGLPAARADQRFDSGISTTRLRDPAAAAAPSPASPDCATGRHPRRDRARSPTKYTEITRCSASLRPERKLSSSSQRSVRNSRTTSGEPST